MARVLWVDLPLIWAVHLLIWADHLLIWVDMVLVGPALITRDPVLIGALTDPEEWDPGGDGITILDLMVLAVQ